MDGLQHGSLKTAFPRSLILEAAPLAKSWSKRDTKNFQWESHCMPVAISLRLWFRVLNDVRGRWGNMPATDVINLACNEKDSARDFSLAYIGMYMNILPLHHR